MINKIDVRKFYEILNNKEIEIRSFYEGSKGPRYFVSSVEEAIEKCEQLDGKYNIYFGVNERSKGGASNKDVIGVTTIPLDIDCIEKPATDRDLEKAREVCEKIISDLEDNGYQAPPYAMSGNGYQIFIQIPVIKVNNNNREEISQKLHSFTEWMIKNYSNDIVRLDKVSDLARIMRVPGTFNMKSKTYSKLISKICIDDVKLRKDILNIEVDVNVVSPTTTTGGQGKRHAFLDFCLTHELPVGERNKIISSNLASYLYDKSNRDILEKNYYRIQKMTTGDLKGWFDKIDKEGIEKVKINNGALINYSRRNKIPFEWKNTPEYIQWKKEERFQKTVDKSREINENIDYTELQKNVLQFLLLKQRENATEAIWEEIKKNNYIYTTRHDEKNEMWIYRKGIYIPEGKTYIREICRTIVGKLYTSQMANALIVKVEADTGIDQKDFFESANENVGEIPLENGIFNLIEKKLIPFDPKKIFFNKLPIFYDEESTCPNIEKHFKDVLLDGDIEVMFEIFAYLLWKDHFIEKAFMLVGGGRNGKGKTIELMKRFVGIDNCASVPLYNLSGDTFRVSELFGKLANLAGDLSNTALKDTGMFKQITARDLLGAKRKFKSSINFTNYSKQIFACNELPRVYDSSEGFWDRWLLLSFPYKFVEQDVLDNTENDNYKLINPSQIEKISSPEEISGLFNRAVEKLDILRKIKSFSYSKGTDEVKKIWVRGSDSFAAFCMDHLEERYDSHISKKNLRKAYHKYCKEHDLKGSSDMSIKIILEQEFGVVSGRKVDETYTQEYIWEGVKFKEKSKYNYQNGKLEK
jgi:P4 family phage/plasmid primase-like protien